MAKRSSGSWYGFLNQNSEATIPRRDRSSTRQAIICGFPNYSSCLHQPEGHSNIADELLRYRNRQTGQKIPIIAQMRSYDGRERRAGLFTAAKRTVHHRRPWQRSKGLGRRQLQPAVGKRPTAPAKVGCAVVIEGYGPPSDPRLDSMTVTPDPGVIEVNVAPTASFAEQKQQLETLFEEARQARLSTESFDVDGTHGGTGGRTGKGRPGPE